MGKCFHTSRIPILHPWARCGLRTSQHLVWRKPAVKQLSNAELLEMIRPDNENVASTAIAQADLDLDSQEHDAEPQTALPLARIPRLPQSPLTHQGLVTARTRHRTVKPLPSGKRSPFQLKLEKNPYATALATPPRLCVLTGLRLPSYFQIPFGVATHPKTGAPWHLPKLLTQAVSDPGDDEMPNLTSEAEGAQSFPLELNDASTTLQSSIRTLSSTHFVASSQVLAHVSGLTPPKYKRLVPYRWRQDPSVKLPDIVWREDMDVFVLEILRRNLLKTLSYLASMPAAYIAPCKNYDRINNHGQVAAVLWLRRDAGTSIDDKLGNATPTDYKDAGPPPYAMHYHKTRYIPCYNLAALLGPFHLNALRGSRPGHYGDQFAIIKLKRNTVKVQLELWKLLAYLILDGKYG